MKKILLILLLIMPSMIMLADGPKYKFLSSGNSGSIFRGQTSGQYSSQSSRTANAGTRAVNYNDVFRTEAPATGRSLVSSEISISSEEGTTHTVSETGAASGITLGRRGGESVTAKQGSVITAAFSKNGPNTITLGNGKLALDGNAITGPDAGTCQPPASYRSPLGDAIAPLLLLVLAFAAFKFKKN